MAALLSRIGKVVLVRYMGASVIALAVDMGSYLVMLRLGMAATPAAALAYAIGIYQHWLLSSRAVFVGSVAARGPERTRQKALFAASALAGLAVTTGVVGGLAIAGVGPLVAKLVAVVASFAVTWLLRNRIVFRPTALP